MSECCMKLSVLHCVLCNKVIFVLLVFSLFDFCFHSFIELTRVHLQHFIIFALFHRCIDVNFFFFAAVYVAVMPSYHVHPPLLSFSSPFAHYPFTFILCLFSCKEGRSGQLSIFGLFCEQRCKWTLECYHVMQCASCISV